MNKLVFPTLKCAPIEIESNEKFICFYQQGGDKWNEDEGWNRIDVNKKDWNEFIHNLTLFEISK